MIEPDTTRRFQSASEAEEVFATQTKAALIPKKPRTRLEGKPAILENPPRGSRLVVHWKPDLLSISSSSTWFGFRWIVAFLLLMVSVYTTSVASFWALGIGIWLFLAAAAFALFSKGAGGQRLLIRQGHLQFHYRKGGKTKTWRVPLEKVTGVQARAKVDRSEGALLYVTMRSGNDVASFNGLNARELKWIQDIIQLYLVKVRDA